LLEILNDASDARIHETEFAQPLLFIIEYALAKLLMHYGVLPEAFIGHSVGEYVAACLAGVFSFEDGVALVCKRGLLMTAAPKGEMLAIECTSDEFFQYQNAIQGVDFALHNSIQQCVASGSKREIEKLERHLQKMGVAYQKLKVSHAFHSALMNSIASEFKAYVDTVVLSPPQIPMISNVTGDWLSAQDVISSEYWYKHLRYTVQMVKGFETLLADQYSSFVEVGPGSHLKGSLQNIAKDKKQKILIVTTLPNHQKKMSDVYQFLYALGILWQEGFPIKWPKQENRKKIPLPTYPFQKQRYWIEPDGIEKSTLGTSELYKPVWSYTLPPQTLSDASLVFLKKQNWIVLKDQTGVGEQFIEFLIRHRVQPLVVESGETFKKINPFNFTINFGEKEDHLALISETRALWSGAVILHLLTFHQNKNGEFDRDQTDACLDLSFYSVLFSTQAYLEIVGVDVNVELLLITQGTQQVLGRDRMIPINAALTGMCRSIPQEHQNLKMRLLDVDEEGIKDIPNLFSQVIMPCLMEPLTIHHQIIAHRNGLRWDLQYTKERIKRNELPFKDNGVYLITGGVGGIALNLCNSIIQEVKNPIFILLSRQTFPPKDTWPIILADVKHPFFKKIQKVVKLQEQGAEIFVNSVDVSKYDELLTCINRVMKTFKKIDGIIHSAGVPGAGIVQLKTREAATQVFLPKILGTYNLARISKAFSMDFVILMSSIAAITGEQGQVDYCAANSVLDAFSTSHLFSAPRVLSINWNTWQDVGMAVETIKPEDISFLNRGNDISPLEGQTLFLKALQNGSPNLIISNDDIYNYADMKSRPAAKTDLGWIKKDRSILSVDSEYVAPTHRVEKTLVKIWEEILGITPIGLQDDFFSLGGHSLKVLSLIEKITQQYHYKLGIQEVYQAPTISQLSKLIINSSEIKHIHLFPLKVSERAQRLIFFCHPVTGMLYCFDAIVSQWTDQDVSLYGLQDPSIGKGKLLYNSLSEMAEAYLTAIKEIQSEGPYFLVGYSMGGNIAYEIAHLLKKQGNTIGLLALIDSWAIFSEEVSEENQFKLLLQKTNPGLSDYIVHLSWERMKLLLSHQLTKVNQEMLLLKAMDLLPEYERIDQALNGWELFNSGKIHCFSIRGNHETIISGDNNKDIFKILQSNFLPYAINTTERGWL
jgi:malonyl CoA-acyl carrier protein transacylase